MIAPILKPANEHLDEFLARKAALIASSTAPKWKKHASRVLDYAHVRPLALGPRQPD
jgi:hypothetical protein